MMMAAPCAQNPSIHPSMHSCMHSLLLKCSWGQLGRTDLKAAVKACICSVETLNAAYCLSKWHCYAAGIAPFARFLAEKLHWSVKQHFVWLKGLSPQADPSSLPQCLCLCDIAMNMAQLPTVTIKSLVRHSMPMPSHASSGCCMQ